MILYNIKPSLKIKHLTYSKTSKVHRRNKKVGQLTKINKDFLKALGFKV